MAQINRKIGKTVVKVLSFQNPLFQAVYGENMAKIMNAGSLPPSQM
jgi:hypothetical protein